MSTDYIITLDNIKREFQRRSEIIHAVDGVSLNITRGSFNILRGKSGSGKTTLLNMIAMIDRPTSGTMYFNGENVTEVTDNRRDNIRRTQVGIIFQNTALIAHMSAIENVEFALSIAGIKSQERKRQAINWLDIMGIKERRNHMPAEMSGGEQARVAIGRALAHEPILLLADEPTSELDTKTSFVVVDMFRELVDKKGITIVMTTHDVNIMDVADNIFTMEDGRIIDEVKKNTITGRTY